MIDFPLNLRDDKEDRTWCSGSELLSLDRFERFWPDVGLVLDNGEAVKSAIRDALRAQYAMEAANRAKWDADPDAPDTFEYTDRMNEFAQTCFRTINETAGTKDAERLATWLTGPALAANKRSGWHRIWGILFYRMGEHDPSTLASHGIPNDTARKLVDIAARFRSEEDAIEKRIEAADLEPLSGWDAVVYEEVRRENPEGSPFIGLSLMLGYLAFERVWAALVRCTPPTYIDALLAWGRADIGPDDKLYEHVTMPNDVREAWQQAWRN